MRALFCVTAAVVLALTAGAARGDGLFYKLPKDGAWVSYDFTATMQRGETRESGKGSIWLGSVGQATVEGKKCRWIEMQFEMTQVERNIVSGMIIKALIPEADVAKGKNPLDHVVRAWSKEHNGEAKRLENPQDISNGPLPLVLAGPLQDVRQLLPKNVSSKLGMLSCVGLTGSVRLEGRRKEVFEVKFHNRLHEKSPFGVVTSRWEMEIVDEGKTEVVMAWSLKLGDLGQRAKSKLPEQQ